MLGITPRSPSFSRADPMVLSDNWLTKSEFSVLSAQKDAWLAEIALLQAHLVGLTGSLFLEFNIPRMGRRIDVVLLIGPVVFVVEFKVGKRTFDRSAVDQVWDYALDLKNFHRGEPCCCDCSDSRCDGGRNPPSQLKQTRTRFTALFLRILLVFVTLSSGVCESLRAALDTNSGRVRLIIRRRRSLRRHGRSMRSTRSRPSRDTMLERKTCVSHPGGLRNSWMRRRAQGAKLICFVTGVPGAGKTLVGLNLATGGEKSINQRTLFFFWQRSASRRSS